MAAWYTRTKAGLRVCGPALFAGDQHCLWPLVCIRNSQGRQVANLELKHLHKNCVSSRCCLPPCLHMGF